MMELVFLLEEPSMKEALNILLPSLLPETVSFCLIKHEGKSDLEKSIPRKLRAYNKPNVKFVVIRDQDSSDCKVLKEQLKKLCSDGGQPDSLIRIACHELESWFLGDLLAVEVAFNITGLSNLQRKAKFRDPDNIVCPSLELKKIASKYQKLSGSRAIAEKMNIGHNRSKSFNIFITGVQKIIQTG